MMEELNVIIAARSAEEAIEEATHSYEIPAGELQAEAIDEPNEAGEVRYRITRKEIIRTLDPTAARELLRGLLEAMEVQATFEDRLEDGYLHMDIQTEDAGLLVGKHGKTLESLQLMMNLMVQKRDPDCGLRIVLDAGGYRSKRTDQLREMAEKAVARVVQSKNEYEFEPMNPADRRVIHKLLLQSEGITTFSRGLGEDRYVVIAPVGEDGQPLPQRPRSDRERGGRGRGFGRDRGGRGGDRGGRGGGGGRDRGGRGFDRGPRPFDRDRGGRGFDRDRGPRHFDRDRGPRSHDRDRGAVPPAGPIDPETLALLEGESLSGRLARGEATPQEVFGGDRDRDRDRDRGGRGFDRDRGPRQGGERDRGGRGYDRGPRQGAPRDDRGGRGGGERRGPGGGGRDFNRDRRGSGPGGERRGPERRGDDRAGSRGGERRPTYRLPDNEPLWASEGKDPEFD